MYIYVYTYIYIHVCTDIHIQLLVTIISTAAFPLYNDTSRYSHSPKIDSYPYVYFVYMYVYIF